MPDEPKKPEEEKKKDEKPTVVESKYTLKLG